jgi:transcription antitermination protein NusB
LALQGLCCFDVQGDNVLDLIMDFIADCDASPNTIGSARDLLSGTLEDTERCNELLQRHCRHWGLARLALVDRGILRLGVHELLAGQAPPKVVIAESLKLAREFSTAESPRFINGVLDSVVKELATGNGVATGNGQLATGNDNDNGDDNGLATEDTENGNGND